MFVSLRKIVQIYHSVKKNHVCNLLIHSMIQQPLGFMLEFSCSFQSSDVFRLQFIKIYNWEINEIYTLNAGNLLQLFFHKWYFIQRTHYSVHSEQELYADVDNLI